MSRRCEMCNKGTTSGQNVPRKGLARKKGGGGVKIGIRTKRTFKPKNWMTNQGLTPIKEALPVCAYYAHTGWAFSLLKNAERGDAFALIVKNKYRYSSCCFFMIKELYL